MANLIPEMSIFFFFYVLVRLVGNDAIECCIENAYSRHSVSDKSAFRALNKDSIFPLKFWEGPLVIPCVAFI